MGVEGDRNWLKERISFFKKNTDFFFGHAHGLQDLAFLTRIKPVPLAMKVLSPNYWTAREFQDSLLYQVIDQRETKHAENKEGVSKSS